MFPIILFVINSATGRRRDIKIPLSQSAQHAEEFNIVSNDHGRTQKCNFCVSVCKTNFTDHHTPNIMNGFRDSVLVCKMHDRYKCHKMLLHDTQKFRAFILIRLSHQAMQAIATMKTNHFKILLNVFSTTYTCSNCIVYRLFYC